MSQLAENLMYAWRDRAQRALDELEHAAKAPALFKPEHVARLQAEAEHASAQMHYWLEQVAA